VFVGCGKKPLDPIVEKAIRKELKKPTGELTKTDLEKVKTLYLDGNQLTEVPKRLEELTQLTKLDLVDNQLTSAKGLEKLTKLTRLFLQDNPDLTKAQIDGLKKALPKCYIGSNPTK
jgi:Leucine-rich repeat (LRR) protein